jgi:hypothetical protein
MQDDDGSSLNFQHFKTFLKCRLIGPAGSNSQLFSQQIRYKASKYAEAFDEIIDIAIDQVSRINEDIDLNMVNDSDQDAVKPYGINHYKPKLELSVPQIGLLGRIFETLEIIKVSKRQNVFYIRWIAEHFQSKNRTIIQNGSLRKNFYTPDLAAIDFWIKTFNSGIALLEKVREQILK